jgi:proteasome accessory factor B
MTTQRTERLLNLVICLLSSRRYVSREQIRTAVPQYSDSGSDDAFERMFERDKDDLREMGIPIETGSNDVLFEDEIGYRIPRDSYFLPEVTFDPQELAVLGLAARMWQQAALADAATSAVLKLEAAGVDVDSAALSVIEPRVGGDEPAFGPLYAACRDGRPVSFDYVGGGDAVPMTRHLQPWGLVSWHGRWYVVGHDTDREQTRVFRLSRISGSVDVTGAPGSVEVPADVDLRQQVAWLAPEATRAVARLRVRTGRALPLRRRSTVLDDDGEWSTLEIGFADAESLAAEICGYAADVVAIDPPNVRSAVVRRLGLVAAGSEAGA